MKKYVLAQLHCCARVWAEPAFSASAERTSWEILWAIQRFYLPTCDVTISCSIIQVEHPCRDLIQIQRGSCWTCNTIRQVIPFSKQCFKKKKMFQVGVCEDGTLLAVMNWAPSLHQTFVIVEMSHVQRDKQEFLQLANGTAAPYGNKQLTQQFRRWFVRVNRKLNHVRQELRMLCDYPSTVIRVTRYVFISIALC